VTGVRVHRLRVALLDVGPPTVWRRVHVPSAATLGVLHQVVQAVMGWQGHHLHAFTAAWGRRSDADTPDTETVALAAVLPKVGDRLVYVYDFGDHWEHLIEVEQVHRPAPRIRYPRCPAGAGACPPEDCGGPPGYHDLQRALRSRKGWRYQQAREAFGAGRWDPAAVDLAAADAALEPLRPPPAEPTTQVVRPGKAAAAAARTALDPHHPGPPAAGRQGTVLPVAARHRCAHLAGQPICRGPRPPWRRRRRAAAPPRGPGGAGTTRLPTLIEHPFDPAGISARAGPADRPGAPRYWPRLDV
jgi:hypothetical protein